MSNQFYLIQRGKFNSADKVPSATALIGSHPDLCLISPDYMGAAEFEFGAIPHAYRRIMGQFDQYSLETVPDLVPTSGVPFNLFCRSDRRELIVEALKEFIEKPYRLKEFSNMDAQFRVNPDIHDPMYKYEIKTNFWWCIDITSLAGVDYGNQVGDWMAFTGAADRQNAFKRIIQNDYKFWWMKKSEQDRMKEYQDSFSW